jgi:hypothetical protein
MTRLAIALPGSVVLAGCFASTPKQFEEVARSVVTLDVASNYQATYRKVLTNARQCWSVGMIGGAMVVTGDLYTDIRSGQIQVGVHGGLGIMLDAVFDIKAVDEGNTRVVVSQRYEHSTTQEQSGLG